MSGRERFARLSAALEQCALHASVLDEARREATGLFPMTAERIGSIGKPERRILDQMAYRFGKLQDTLGEIVLPGFLTAVEEPIAPTATFAEKLQRLERLGAVPSAEEWRMLREVRNALAHEYPDEPELQAEPLNRFEQAVVALLAVWEASTRFAAAHAPGAGLPPPPLR